ncbi:glycoside hydrolase family 2 TIM barrel-domain containing protein [Cephaloticoccus primus]|nr:glycoside hydrolase family 2 TIM barrel-domain containing protein [Cephaloticoccus primus]
MKKMTTGALAALILVSSTSASAPRLRMLLDEQWRFQLGEWLLEHRAVPDYAQVDYDDSDWQELDLPHDWSIGLPPNDRRDQFQDGVGWYRKTLRLDSAWLGQRVVVEFEGVYCNPEVFVNGRKAGQHAYGYTPFTVDLTEYLKDLSVGDPVLIAVRVDNSQQPSARWGFSGSGIYRHVWLHVFGPTHIVADGINAVTTALDTESGGEATLRVETHLRSFEKTLGRLRNVRVRLSVLDLQEYGACVATAEVTDVLVSAEQRLVGTLKIPNPRAWSPESPSLYRVVAQLYNEAGALLDEYSVVTGIRTLAWSFERGLELNGKSIKLNGGNIHHDTGILGAAAFDRAEGLKVQWLKKAGFNAVRTAHNPHSRAFLEACDKLGLLVVDEIFDVWTTAKAAHDYRKLWDEWHQHDLETWVRRDRHHPSVVLWSIGNEIPESGKPEGEAIARELSGLVRALDSTRPVTMGQDVPWAGGGWTSLDPVFSLLDIAGYNYSLVSRDASLELAEGDDFKVYPGPPRYIADLERAPDRIMYASESFQSEVFTNWLVARDHAHVLGDFVWTALDYLGDGGLGLPHMKGVENAHWWRNAYCGDIDLTGWRKPVSHYREILWHGAEPAGKKLYMAVHVPPPALPEGAESADLDMKGNWIGAWAVEPLLPTWNWPGREGELLTVEVYSRYEAVRLYLNGEKIGEQSTTETDRYKTRFTLPYMPGRLVAVGLSEGNEVERFELKTVGAPVKLRAVADRAVGYADGQDIFFVTIEALDEADQWNLWAAHAIEVDVEGAGALIGLGTGNSVGGTSYPESHFALFQGRALAAIRTTRESGPITVRVTSAGGLAGAELRLETRPR